MTDHEIPKKQWTHDAHSPSGDAVSLEKAQILRDATAESEALQEAVEADDEEKRADAYDRQGVPPDQIEAWNTGRGLGYIAFRHMRQEVDAMNAGRRKKDALPPESWRP